MGSGLQGSGSLCRSARDWLSARLDDELLTLPDELPAAPGEDVPPSVVRHVAECAACRAWGAEVERLHRTARVRPAEQVPDLTGRILDALLVEGLLGEKGVVGVPGDDVDAFATRGPGRSASGGWPLRSAVGSTGSTGSTGSRSLVLTARRRAVAAARGLPVRWFLLPLAAVQAGVALLHMVTALEPAPGRHATADAGALELSLAAALAVAAHRPGAARAVALFSTAVAAGLAFTAGLAMARGAVSAWSEAHHLLVVAAVALAWAVPPPTPTRARARARAW